MRSDVPVIPDESGLLARMQPVPCKVYRRRWLMLGIFMTYSMTNSAQWIQYTIISNIVVHYYGVSSHAVQWTSLIFMFMYAILIFPGIYLLRIIGLHRCLILGVLGMAAGAWIKCFSVSPDRFLVTFVGQVLVGGSQVFILSIPPELASIWFGENQVATACALGVFGNQLGVAAGFCLTPEAVRNHSNLDDVGTDLAVMFYFMAGITTLTSVLIIFLFRERPPMPPSLAAAKRGPRNGGICKSMGKLLRNKNFKLLLLSYGIILAVINTFSTELNLLILRHFKNGEIFAGRAGVVTVVGGMLGSLASGISLDRTHKYKETMLILYVLSSVAMLVFTFVIAMKSHLAVYISSVVLGVTICGYIPVGFEFASELTYPESESTTAGLLTLCSSVMSVIFAMVYSWLFNVVGDLWANISMATALMLGSVVTALIQPVLKRTMAQALERTSSRAVAI